MADVSLPILFFMGSFSNFYVSLGLFYNKVEQKIVLIELSYEKNTFERTKFSEF